jgi:DNA-binding response OmpR family regulator
MEADSREAKILIIDDDPDILDALSTSIEIPHYSVQISTAPDAKTGLKKIKEEGPNLILLDYNLPGEDGFDVVEKIKEVPQWRSIKIIMLTAEGTKQKLWESIDREIDDFIAKPFDLLELEARVFQQLNKQETERPN